MAPRGQYGEIVVEILLTALSRAPAIVSDGMLSNSLCEELGSITGVLPILSTCLGLRTGAAGNMIRAMDKDSS